MVIMTELFPFFRYSRSISLSRLSLRCVSSMASPRFIPSRLDAVENIGSEQYWLGGFHPMSIGDVFADAIQNRTQI